MRPKLTWKTFLFFHIFHFYSSHIIKGQLFLQFSPESNVFKILLFKVYLKCKDCAEYLWRSVRGPFSHKHISAINFQAKTHLWKEDKQKFVEEGCCINVICSLFPPQIGCCDFLPWKITKWHLELNSPRESGMNIVSYKYKVLFYLSAYLILILSYFLNIMC